MSYHIMNTKKQIEFVVFYKQQPPITSSLLLKTDYFLDFFLPIPVSYTKNACQKMFLALKLRHVPLGLVNECSRWIYNIFNINLCAIFKDI